MNNVRTRGKIGHEEWPKIAERFRNGDALAEIARSYRCTAPAIRYIVRRVEQGKLRHRKPEMGVADVAGVSRNVMPHVVSVGGRPPANGYAAGSPADAIWDRISRDIASFLAAMDSATGSDSDDDYEALLVATDRLLKASARTRLEVERTLHVRKMERQKKAVR